MLINNSLNIWNFFKSSDIPETLDKIKVQKPITVKKLMICDTDRWIPILPTSDKP